MQLFNQIHNIFPEKNNRSTKNETFIINNNILKQKHNQLAINTKNPYLCM